MQNISLAHKTYVTVYKYKLRKKTNKEGSDVYWFVCIFYGEKI